MTNQAMKKALAVLFAIACAATLSGCKKQEGFDHSHDDIAVYVMWMRFDSPVGRYNDFMHHYLTNGCDDIVLVASEYENDGYPGGVIVAWPSEETEQILWQINWYIDLQQLDLSPYSLTNPLTVEDALVHWEEIMDFLENGLDSSEFSLLTDPYSPIFKR